MVASLTSNLPAEGMEYIACPLCNADRPQRFFAGGDLLHPGAERFHLVTCGACGHIYQNPRPTLAAIGQYYPADYAPFVPAIEDEPRRLRRLERRYGRHMRCAAVHRAAGRRPGRILDVGAATGIFLDGMRRFGWETLGVEPTERAVRYARERLGLEVIHGRLEETHLPAASFNAITMWDVLEHVHDPRAVLAETARLLRPGGLLVLSLPNPDSLEARLFGPHWLGWDLPRHLNIFRPALLRALLARYGMPVERIRSPIHGYALFVLSLAERAKAKGRDPRFITRALYNPPLRLLTMPYYRGPANWYNLSSTMIVYARRAPSPL
jgi:SAM-dependent methyltransferase